MGESRLPQELVDIVIDHLYSNRAALRRCSLVARAWVPSTRYHLFSTLRVQIGGTQQLRWANFIEMTSNALCTFLPYARCLLISFPKSGVYNNSWGMISELKELIPRFPSLDTLRCFSIPILWSEEWNHLLNFPGLTSRIKTLRIPEGSFDDIMYVYPTISSFGCLETLEWQDMVGYDESDYVDSDGTSKPSNKYGRIPESLRVIDLGPDRFRWASFKLICRWLTDCQVKWIHTMRIGDIPDVGEEEKSIKDYLAFVGSSLEVLVLDTRPSWGGSFMERLDLRQNSNLKVLELASQFSICRPFNMLETLAPFHTLNQGMDSFPPSLVKLVFPISVSKAQKPPIVKGQNRVINNIDNRLQQYPFAKLEKIVFTVEDGEIPLSSVKWLEDLFPNCSRRGMVYFEVRPMSEERIRKQPAEKLV